PRDRDPGPGGPDGVPRAARGSGRPWGRSAGAPSRRGGGGRRENHDRGVRARVSRRRYGRYWIGENRSSFSKECSDSIERTVPERERITIECVLAPSGQYFTPRNR